MRFTLDASRAATPVQVNGDGVRDATHVTQAVVWELRRLEFTSRAQLCEQREKLFV